MDSPDVSKEDIGQIVAVLEEMHVPYVIGGSVALSVWAIPRMTHDLDIVVDLPEDLITEFCSRFSEERYHIDAAAMRTSFSFRNYASMGMYSAVHRTQSPNID